MNDTPNPAEGQITYCRLDILTLSDMNPRDGVTDAEIRLLAQSIMAAGILQNLLGYRRMDGIVEIVAGGRRLRALELIAGSMPNARMRVDLSAIPVKVTDDPEIAIVWAGTENAARDQLHPADEIRAYVRAQKAGQTLNDIAICFAVTEAHVRRRLALAAIPEAALDALKAGKISLGQAAVMTLARGETMAADMLESALRGANEYSLRRVAEEGGVSGKTRQALFVGLAAYEAAGGAATRDLFSDNVVLHNPEVLGPLYEAGIARVREEALQRGFAWARYEADEYFGAYNIREPKMTRAVGVLNDEDEVRYSILLEAAEDEEGGLDDEDQADLERLEAMRGEAPLSADQRALSGMVYWVTSRGDLKFSEGHVAAKDVAAAIAAGFLAPHLAAAGEKASAPEPAEDPLALPAAVIADLRAVRLAAVQAGILDDTGLALDLAAFAMTPESRVGYGSIAGVTIQRAPVTPSFTDGYAAPGALAPPAAPDNARDRDLVAAWKAFLARTESDRRAVLARALIPGLGYNCASDFMGGVGRPGAALFNHLEKAVKSRMRGLWTPTAENFFKRAKSAYLDQVFCDVTGQEPTTPAGKTFAGLKKGQKAAVLGDLFAGADNEVAKLTGLYAVADMRATEKRAKAWAPAFDGGARK